MINEKILITAHNIPRTANTTAMQNRATRILSDNGISFTSFLRICYLFGNKKGAFAK
jgi:hypothetical protein